MKKTIVTVLCFVLSMSLASCAKAPVSESSTSSSPESFYIHSIDEMVWDDNKDDILEEFPGVIFRWNHYNVDAVTEEKTVRLISGMPILNVYFYDLTVDGNREILLNCKLWLRHGRQANYCLRLRRRCKLRAFGSGIMTMFSIYKRTPLLRKSVFMGRIHRLNPVN